MGLLKRIFSRDKQQNQKASATSRLFSFLGAGNGAIWSNDRYDIFSRETYIKNVVAFRCIDEISRAVSSVPWELFRKTEGEEGREIVEDHPVSDLLTRPNPEESFNFLMLKATAFLPIAGNTFFERVKIDSGLNAGMIKELFILRPDRVKVLPNKVTGTIGGYEFEANGRKVNWEVDPITLQSDVLHVKTFHPLDDWYGLAATKPTSREIDTSNQAVDWNKSLLDNQGRPGMLFETEETLGDQQFERLEQMLNQKYSGGKDAGRNLILEGGMSAKPYGFTPNDMDFLKGKEDVARNICMGYGVPPMLIGIPGEATFANFAEARLAFWENTVFWYLGLFRGELNNWLFSEEEKGFFIDYSLDDIPALAPRREKVWERAQTSDFLMINEKREMVGKEKIEGGDVILVPATMLPLIGDDVDEANLNDENQPIDEDDQTEEEEQDE